MAMRKQALVASSRNKVRIEPSSASRNNRTSAQTACLYALVTGNVNKKAHGSRAPGTKLTNPRRRVGLIQHSVSTPIITPSLVLQGISRQKVIVATMGL